MNNDKIKALLATGVQAEDIMHGQLKIDMLEAEEQLNAAVEAEEYSGEAMDSMERTYAEGYLEALTMIYKLTYDISFARKELEESK